MQNELAIYNYLIERIKNKVGVCALMGNLKAEGCGNPKNLENYYEKRLGYTDDTYTKAVDDGSYTRFSNDSAGYGLAQWTYHTRKANLLAYSRTKGTSIGNLYTQLDFLVYELKNGYKSVYDGLVNANNLKVASDLVMTKFENPANQSESAKSTRASYGFDFYKRLATDNTENTEKKEESQNKIIYQIWDDVNNKWQPNVVNDNDYAGIFGSDVCCILINSTQNDVYYKVHIKGKKWQPEVKNRNDYAGVKNMPIDGFMVRGAKEYRVHLRRKNTWLNWVNGYDINNNNNGYAGILGEEIDAIQIR